MFTRGHYEVNITAEWMNHCTAGPVSGIGGAFTWGSVFSRPCFVLFGSHGSFTHHARGNVLGKAHSLVPWIITVLLR